MSRRRFVELAECEARARSSFHDDLTVHPGMRAADVVVDPRLAERHGFHLALGERTGRPLTLFQRARVMRNVAYVGESYRGAGLDARARRRVAVLHVVIADLDRVGGGNRPDRPGDRRGRGWRPERTKFPVQRENPNRVPVGAALQLIAAGRDGNELLAVDLIDDGRGVGAESRLEPPQLLPGLGVEREEVAVRLAAEDKPAGRRRRAAATANAVWGLVLPGDLVSAAVDRGERAAHLHSDRRRLRAADITLAHHVFVAVAGKGAGAHGPRHVEIAGVGTVRHGGPVGTADPRRLDQNRGLPERLEDAAVILITGQPVGTLRDDRVADRIRRGVESGRG